MKNAGAIALVAPAPVCAPSPARAAPDEETLGKSDGSPVCPPSVRIETRYLVGLVSRRD
jgi:hypothetical protein